eukprot:1157514-Pelagomonas_calceolata.AAC.8
MLLCGCSISDAPHSEMEWGHAHLYKFDAQEEFQDETVRKVQALHKYDCMRANKSTMAWGVEARVPFLDKDFVSVAMSVDPKEKMIDKASGKGQAGIEDTGRVQSGASATDLPHDWIPLNNVIELWGWAGVSMQGALRSTSCARPSTRQRSPTCPTMSCGARRNSSVMAWATTGSMASKRTLRRTLATSSCKTRHTGACGRCCCCYMCQTGVIGAVAAAAAAAAALLGASGCQLCTGSSCSARVIEGYLGSAHHLTSSSNKLRPFRCSNGRRTSDYQ